MTPHRALVRALNEECLDKLDELWAAYKADRITYPAYRERKTAIELEYRARIAFERAENADD